MCVCVCDNKKSRAHSPRPLPPPPNYMYIYYVRPKLGRARTHTKIPFTFRPIPSLSAAPLPVTRHHARPVHRSVHPSVKLIVQYFPGFFSLSSTIPLRSPTQSLRSFIFFHAKQISLHYVHIILNIYVLDDAVYYRACINVYARVVGNSCTKKDSFLDNLINFFHLRPT